MATPLIDTSLEESPVAYVRNSRMLYNMEHTFNVWILLILYFLHHTEKCNVLCPGDFEAGIV